MMPAGVHEGNRDFERCGGMDIFFGTIKTRQLAIQDACFLWELESNAYVLQRFGPFIRDSDFKWRHLLIRPRVEGGMDSRLHAWRDANKKKGFDVADLDFVRCLPLDPPQKQAANGR